MVEFLPPPDGLDLREIESEPGLLAAIQREADKLDQAKRDRRRLSRDEIRLISFLAGEVRRRIEDLPPEQQDEIQNIRLQAREREMEARVSQVAADVEAFVDAANAPGGEVRFSRINELEGSIQAMVRNLESDPEKYSPHLEHMADLAKKLEEIKGRGRVFGGLPEF